MTFLLCNIDDVFANLLLGDEIVHGVALHCSQNQPFGGGVYGALLNRPVAPESKGGTSIAEACSDSHFMVMPTRSHKSMRCMFLPTC